MARLISAEESFKISKAKLEEKTKEGLDRVNNAIRNASLRGDTSVVFSDNSFKETNLEDVLSFIKDLKQLGYEIEEYTSWAGYKCIAVKWENVKDPTKVNLTWKLNSNL